MSVPARVGLVALILLGVTAGAVEGKRKPAWTWRSLHRPLHLPTVAEGAPCPLSPGRSVRLGKGDVMSLAGPGPAYPVLAGGNVLNFFWPPQGEARGSGWSGNKAMWIVAERYRGPVLVRARQLDGPHLVRFGVYEPLATEFKVSTRLTSVGSRVRREPSTTRVEAEGCYAYQIDGTTFSRVIVFEARIAPLPS